MKKICLLLAITFLLGTFVPAEAQSTEGKKIVRVSKKKTRSTMTKTNRGLHKGWTLGKRVGQKTWRKGKGVTKKTYRVTKTKVKKAT